jgi:hypothetical protein
MREGEIEDSRWPASVLEAEPCEGREPSYLTTRSRCEMAASRGGEGEFRNRFPQKTLPGFHNGHTS